MSARNECVVVDTNLLLVADGQAIQMSQACRLDCEKRLHNVIRSERVALDQSRLILMEYGNKVKTTGQPSVGKLFLKWVLTNQQQAGVCDPVKITPKNAGHTDFQEFPDSEDLSDFDAEDRKFVAVANAHPDKPPILQSTDTKWLNWEQPLSDCGIQLEILCRDELILIRQRKAKRK